MNKKEIRKKLESIIQEIESNSELSEFEKGRLSMVKTFLEITKHKPVNNGMPEYASPPPTPLFTEGRNFKGSLFPKDYYLRPKYRIKELRGKFYIEKRYKEVIQKEQRLLGFVVKKEKYVWAYRLLNSRWLSPFEIVKIEGAETLEEAKKQLKELQETPKYHYI